MTEKTKYQRPAALESFYSSIAWKECREGYKKKVGGLCELCLKDGLYTPAEIVHHKVPLDVLNVNDPSISLSFDNLQCVCREHHQRLHTKRQLRYDILPDGTVVTRPDST